ncbi:MAG TPA: 4-amino-4-deoxy-L-arabinose transferase, partial [Isosphaeraceae bacterium]
MTARRALLCLIVVSGALRLGWAAAVGLGHDEAYHYLFTVHRDWSYFDHPPMLALVESVGPALLGSAAPGALRLGFVALFAGSTWLLARLTTRS